MDYIAFTKVALPYGWLGNMSPYPIEYMGKTWRTSESLFQALRFKDEDIIDKINLEKSPMGAKFKAKANKSSMVVKPQSEEDISNMRMCIKLKLEQNPRLKELLLETGDSSIIEDCTSRKRGSGLFWGAALLNGEWIGENILGKIWEDERLKLQNQNKDEKA